jgi:hypothetical protein
MKLHRLIVPALTLLACHTVRADDRLFLAGAEYADAAYYTYTGLVLPGPGRENGRGFLQRYWLDRFGYEYLGGPGRVEASAWGAEAALGYGASSANGWWSVWLGIRHTDTDLTPDDPSAEARGSQTGAKVQAEFERALSSAWRFGAMGSYASQQNGYWGRARLMYSPTAARSYGVEVVANGNDEADSTATGLVLTARPASGKFTVSLKAGYRFQDDDYDGAYGGVEFGYGF